MLLHAWSAWRMRDASTIFKDIHTAYVYIKKQWKRAGEGKKCMLALKNAKENTRSQYAFFKAYLNWTPIFKTVSCMKHWKRHEVWGVRLEARE